ncbi:hypothetical protein ACWZEH_07520 [Streptomyces sp. QTS137]
MTTGDRAVGPRRAVSGDGADGAAAVRLWPFAAALPGVVRPRSDDEVYGCFRHVLVPRGRRGRGKRRTSPTAGEVRPRTAVR